MNSLVLADRRKAAHLIARWLDGDATNYQIDDEWPWESEDLAVVHIGGELWTQFDDFPETRLAISSLKPEEVELLRRCLAFLRSDEEYQPVARAQSKGTMARLGKLFGFARRIPEATPLDIPVARRQWWPFADEAQWRKAA